LTNLIQHKGSGKMYFRSLIYLVALGLGGCAMTSGHHSGPNGRPVYYIDGMSAGVAYSKASQLCPGGYTILGNPQQTTPLDYVMTVECK
jgi:hypothetical protein